MPSAPLPLSPHPTQSEARRDWYRTASLTLAWVALVGVGSGLVGALLHLPDWFSRASLTAAGLALACHVALSVALSRTPRLET